MAELSCQGSFQGKQGPQSRNQGSLRRRKLSGKLTGRQPPKFRSGPAREGARRQPQPPVTQGQGKSWLKGPRSQQRPGEGGSQGQGQGRQGQGRITRSQG